MATPEYYFDAIVMDTEIIKDSDIKAVDRIRHLDNDYKASIPIVAITSGEDETNSDKFADLHTPFYFSKPYDLKEMVGVFSRIFNK